MTAYIKAADSFREAFDCAVIIVHHCGVEETRPRGHTSLTGAADAQISVKRDPQENIIVEVECAKDGPQGDQIVSRLESIELGLDEDGEAITSCIVVPGEPSVAGRDSASRLTPNQQTMFSILHEAGPRGLSLDAKRPATLLDIRVALKGKGLIQETMNGWTVKQT